jgi:hypothetical protein
MMAQEKTPEELADTLGEAFREMKQQEAERDKEVEEFVREVLKEE